MYFRMFFWHLSGFLIAPEYNNILLLEFSVLLHDFLVFSYISRFSVNRFMSFLRFEWAKCDVSPSELPNPSPLFFLVLLYDRVYLSMIALSSVAQQGSALSHFLLSLPPVPNFSFLRTALWDQRAYGMITVCAPVRCRLVALSTSAVYAFGVSALYVHLGVVHVVIQGTSQPSLRFNPHI